MVNGLLRMFNDGAQGARGRVSGLFALLIGFNLAAWAWALIAFRDNPLLLGTALLAYSFGLRHAFDADHIAAVDNVTRKLMQEGKRPFAVGFFFSLGHSTVVVALAIGVAITAAALETHFAALKEIGSVVGTLVSTAFLFLIAAANFFILRAVWREFRRVRNGGKLKEENLDMLLAGGGVMTHLFRRLFRLIERSWQMYPLGFLFGLGFDTATEVGLLGISAAEASKGLSIWSILVFPALFTAGMSLMDTTDGVLMIGAYNWAFAKPIRKLYYNLTITFVSVMVAVIIGGIEALGLIGDKLGLEGGFWDAIGALNDNFGTLGYAIVGIFIVSWAVSVAIYRLKRYDELGADA
ncbi:MAG TPA: HoxN/HupN/NixA family nickel/cobalt transporter [Magnetospirillaceae bacterium]|jgi:high-affinity nickel-transport protein